MNDRRMLFDGGTREGLEGTGCGQGDSAPLGEPSEQTLEDTICIVGLGYVGLPLSVHFDIAGFDVVGYDISTEKIQMLDTGTDPTGDVGDGAVDTANIEFTTDASSIRDASYVIVTVPTPIDEEDVPNLEYVEQSGETIGRHLSKGTTVVLESTVFPGATKQVLAPAIESTSGMTAGEDFFIGYSPERLVPGDDEHGLESVVKIVSGQNDSVCEDLAELYEHVVDAGIHQAPTIEVAEAAKCVENIQRDLNIALMNELAIACNGLGIDTHDVLEAAGTKWNFHEYEPGLVGGHCIPVDPFFFIHESEKNGFDPELIRKAREVNEYIPKHVAMETINELNDAEKVIKHSRVLVLGLTYKSNVADIRASAVDSLIERLQNFGVDVAGYDPHADNEYAREEFGIDMLHELSFEGVDGIVIGAGHDEFQELDMKAVGDEMNDQPVVVDTNGSLADQIASTDITYTRL